MKRRALALCAGMLLLGLLPRPTLANVPSNLDQLNNPSGVVSVSLPSGPPTTVAQTFTAGKSGLLSGVDLYTRMDPAGTINLSIEGTTSGGLPDGTDKVTSSASVPITEGWIHFSFWSPLSVTAGTVYAIVFSGVSTIAYASLDTYPGARDCCSPDRGLPSAVPRLTSPQNVRRHRDDGSPVGQATDHGRRQHAADPHGHDELLQRRRGVQLLRRSGHLPSWYTVTGVTCPAQISPVDCTAANLETGFHLFTSGTGATLDVHAHRYGLAGLGRRRNLGVRGRHRLPRLPSCARGSPECADGRRLRHRQCQRASHRGRGLADSVPVRPGRDGSAERDRGLADSVPVPPGRDGSAERGPTAPPTSTGVGPASDDPGSTIWFLPIALVALFGGLLFLVARQRRRIL